jgi:hypothetical protein
VKTAAAVPHSALRKANLRVGPAFHRPAALWLLPARVEQTRVGHPRAFAPETTGTSILSLRDCGKHRFRLAGCGL